MTTAEQWEHMAREANAAAVKAMAEADRLRAELAALRAAGGQEKPTDGYSHPPCCPCPVGMDDRGCSDCLNTGHTHAPDLPMWDDTVDGIRRRHARITAQIDRVWSGEERPDEIADHELAVDHAAKVDVAILLALLPAAAPVGGQAEPSDAQIDADLALDGFDPKDRYPEHGHDALRTAYRSGWESAGMAAAAVSGEQL